MRKLFFILICAGLSHGQENEADPDALEDDFQQNPKMEKAGDIRWNAQNKFIEDKRKLEAAYRSQLAESFRLVDRAEIMLLDFEPTPRPTDLPPGEFYGEVEGFERKHYLFIPNYGAYSKILKTKKVGEESKDELVNAMVSVFREPPRLQGPMCHHPIHGVRLYIANELLFETSFCWHCGNYFMRMTGAWDGMWVDFHGEKLEAFLKKELPIPQAQLDRLDAKYGANRKKK
jgi:hypothetical protein